MARRKLTRAQRKAIGERMRAYHAARRRQRTTGKVIAQTNGNDLVTRMARLGAIARLVELNAEREEIGASFPDLV